MVISPARLAVLVSHGFLFAARAWATSTLVALQVSVQCLITGLAGRLVGKMEVAPGPRCTASQTAASNARDQGSQCGDERA